MTREEEIKKQADIYTDDASNYAEWSDDGGWSDTNDIELIEKAFIEGAKYADKTMLDRACEWLNKILYIHTEINEDKDWGETNTINWVTSDYDSIEEFINAFKQAMEEEL